MGAYSPAPIVTNELHKKILDEVMYPTMEGLIKEESPYLGFLYAGLMIKDNKIKIDDESTLFTRKNIKVKFINGDRNNHKITYLNDLKNNQNYYGIGFDVHRLVPGRKLYLGGLKIKSEFGTLGHSDGDPVLHSITDAILGAVSYTHLTLPTSDLV